MWRRQWRGQLGHGGAIRGALVTVAVGIVTLVVATVASGLQPYEAYEEAVSASGPTHQYRFSDPSGSSEIVDNVGGCTVTGNTGLGSVSLGNPGPFAGSKAGSFAGIAYAPLPCYPLKEDSAFSAEGWVYWTGSKTNEPIFEFGSGSSKYVVMTPSSSATKHPLRLEIHTSSATVTVEGTKALPTSTWEYVVVTETSSGTLALYLNGEEIAKKTGAALSPASLGSTVPDNYLANTEAPSESRFHGSLSNIAFYNKALSAGEVKTHYEDGELPSSAEPPANTAAPAITGTATETQSLKASTGTWTGTEPISYGYQWERCPKGGGACEAIASAKASEYVPVASDVGKKLEVTVTATNSAGSSHATSTQTAIVEGFGAGARCDDTWTGEVGDGKWGTAGNWANGEVPSAAGHACVLSTTTVSVTSAATAEWITGDGTIVIAGGSLSVSGPHSSSVAALTLAAGSIAGTGEIDVSEAFVAEKGSLSGSGRLVIATGATGAVSGGTIGLAGHTLVNKGSFSVAAGARLEGGEGASVVNEGTFTLNGSILQVEGSARGSFTNLGLLQKTAGEHGEVEFSIDNESTVSVASGQLGFSGGGSSGSSATDSWSASSGAGIVFSRAAFSLGATAGFSGSITISGEGSAHVTVGRVTGTGYVAVTRTCCTRGVLEVDGSSPSTMNGLTVAGGTLTGSGEVDVSETFAGSATGALEGTGSLVIESGASGSISSSETLEMVERKLVNDGTFQIPAGARLVGGEGASIVNKGTFTLNGSILQDEGTTRGAITNLGSLQKTAGEHGEVEFSIDSESTVSVASGVLGFSGGGSSGSSATDSWSASSGAGIAFSGGAFSLGATASLSGSITVTGHVTAGRLTGTGEVVVGRTCCALGLLEVDGSSPSTLNSLAVASGTLTGSGEVDVTETFTGSTGALKGTGSLVIDSGASGSLSSGETLEILERKLVNRGTFQIPATARLNGGEGASIVNEGTFTLNGSIRQDEGTARGSITNLGLLQKTAGESIEVEFSVDNEHVLQIDSGVLELDGGGESGREAVESWDAQPGAGIVFRRGAYALGAHASLSGSIEISGPSAVVGVGVLEAAEASVSITNEGCCSHGLLEVTGSSASTIGDLTIVGEGVLSHSAEVDVTHVLAGDVGKIEGSGRLVIEPGATATLTEGNAFTLSDSQIVNYGELTVPRKANLFGSGAASIVNENVMIVNGRMTAEGPAVPALTNNGTLRRATESESESSEVAYSFDNEGTVDVEAGRLELMAGGVSGSDEESIWTGGIGTEIEFGRGEFSLGGEVSLAGTFQARGDTVVKVGKVIGTPSLAVTTRSICGCKENALLEVEDPLVVENLFMNFGTLDAVGGTTVSGGLQWNGGKIVGGSRTTLEPGIPANIVEGVLDGSLINETTVDWPDGSITGEAGALFENNGIVEAGTEAPLVTAHLSTAPPNDPVFRNNGEFRARGGVSVEWEFVGNAPEPGGEPECVVCIILDPEAKPPSGICSIAQSGLVTFFPRPGTPFPPQYEPFTHEWKCVDPAMPGE